MTARNTRWLAWFLGALYVALSVVGLILQYWSQTYLRSYGLTAIISITVTAGVLYALGAVIVWHHPRNPIGWLWCAAASVWALDLFSFGYAYHGLIAHPGSLPGADFMLPWQAWTGGTFVIPTVTLLILVFPNGRPFSARWGRVAWIVVAAIGLYLPLDALEPGPLEVFPFLNNPIGVRESTWAVLNPLRGTVLTIAMLCLIAAVFSLILRLRQARGDERQQLKWMMFAVAYFASTLVFVFFAGSGSDDRLMRLATGLHSFAPVGLSVATVIAIFKYRLYDIDLIINRTLVYGTLTGSLALVYFSSVVVLQRVMPADSPLAVVISTLAIAALFSPLRRRIQDGIDRRFYRRKYDAERILSAFSAATRREVDLDALVSELLLQVGGAVQPSFLSLWLGKEDH